MKGRLWFLLFPVVSAFLAGCGASEEKVVSVKGKLVQGGAPYQLKTGSQPLPPGDPGIRVKFTRTGDKSSEVFFAIVDTANGTFDVPGHKGKGIPVGTYSVTVQVSEIPSPTKGSGAPKLGGPGMPPNAAGGKAPSAAGMDGKEIAKQDVTIPDAGVQDLVIEIDAKKK